MHLLPRPHVVFDCFYSFLFLITAFFLVFSIVFVRANLCDKLQHTIACKCTIEAAFKKNSDEMLVAKTGCDFAKPIDQNSVM